MGYSSSGNWTCKKTDIAVEGKEGTHKSFDDVLTEVETKKHMVGKVEDVLVEFRKHGIIASKKKLKLGQKVAFGQFIVEGTEEGVRITPDLE